MEENNDIITLKCPHCGKVFKSKSPQQPGTFSVSCVNPECGQKVVFKFPLKPAEKKEVKFGLLDDGSYRFKCGNSSCGQSVRVPAEQVRKGKNRVLCPKCRVPYEFEIEPTEEDLLRCQTAGCGATLNKPSIQEGIFSTVCKCGQEYSMVIHEGKVVKVTMKTPVPVAPSRQNPMKLVSGHLLSKSEYLLAKGVHYVGRLDADNPSDFSIKDKYASSRSVKIDVNENGGQLVYKLTVEKASNPVYHNNKELTVGDIVYLAYGDTFKLGKTVIKTQKA